MSTPQQPPPSRPDVIPPDRPPDPVVVVLLALFLGPIAYFVAGQWQKGAVGIVVYLFLVVFAVITCGLGAFLFFPAYLFVILDSYFQAKNLKDGFPISQWSFFTSHL